MIELIRKSYEMTFVTNDKDYPVAFYCGACLCTVFMEWSLIQAY